MSLHLPTLAANAIMVHCTRAARAIKANAAEAQRAADARGGNGQDVREYRTLDQVRADIAAILLMGQELPTTTTTTTSQRPGFSGFNASPGQRPGGFTGSNSFTASQGGSSASFTAGPGRGGGSTDQGDGSSVSCGPRGSFDHPGPDAAGGKARAGDSFFPAAEHPAWGTGGGWGSDPASGDVVFGQKSDVGVTVTDEEPPWAHAHPESRPDARPESRPDARPDARLESRPDARLDAEPDARLDVGLEPPRSSGGGGSAPLEGIILSAGGMGEGAGSATTGQASGTTSEGETCGEDMPVVGVVVGDGSGWVEGVVDGVLEHPQAEYLQQLADLANNAVLTDPPLPKALVIVTVPVLGLLGLTEEPGELDDRNAGPVPVEIARKLLAGSSTFLRVLTDPISGDVLPLEPERYTLREAEKAVLQALAGGCYFPNCTNPVLLTDLDHVRAFAHGGQSTLGNLRPACAHHHRLKHFKDDKNRHGTPRRIAEPWRTGIHLPGWTPTPCHDGRIGWTSPSGNYHPPHNTEPPRPAYPKWLKNRINKTLKKNKQNGTQD